MDLGLSLGESNKNAFEFLEKHKPREQMNKKKKKKTSGFCMDLSIGDFVAENENKQDESKQNHQQDEHSPLKNDQSDAPVQLIDLLPHTPVPRSHGFPWSSSENHGSSLAVTTVVEETEELGAALSSSPNSNSGASSFHEMDISLYNNYIGNDGNRFKRDQSEGEGEGEGERGSSRASDEDDTNGSTRKKLRLSKDQSAFLEESFKEHNTLNPKQKLALAKQLNLRPRQVEVWFQNRRARTKLKQTEVDCEYLKRCCEKLTEENRRLNKELQELRALKTSNPFYMQLPATTLTMCPSCERVATSTTTTTTNNNNSTQNITSNTKQANNNSDSKAVGLSIPQNNRPKLFPFSHSQSQSHHSSAAS